MTDQTNAPDSPDMPEDQTDHANCPKRRRLRYATSAIVATAAVVVLSGAMRPAVPDIYAYGTTRLPAAVNYKIATGKTDIAQAKLDHFGTQLTAYANAVHGAEVCKQPLVGPLICDPSLARKGDTTALMQVHGLYSTLQLRVLHARDRG
ncbi:MAG: hypothetical protein AAFQ66_23590 [Pseudomonadota bacterium]